MTNGCDAYGSFYSRNPQTVCVGKPINFECNQNTLNVKHKQCSPDINIRRDGVYYIQLVANFDQTGEFAFYINGCVDRTTVETTDAARQVTSQQILQLKRGDCLTFRNYKSNTSVTTSKTIGSKNPSINAKLTLFKIAPLPCCDPPSPRRRRRSSSSCSKSKSHSNNRSRRNNRHSRK